MEEICRVCLLKKKYLINLLNKIGDHTLKQMLDMHTTLQTNLDLAPKNICQNCTKELLMVIKFHEKCQQTDRILIAKCNNPGIPLISSESKEKDPNESNTTVTETLFVPVQAYLGEEKNEGLTFEDIIECDPDYEVFLDEKDVSEYIIEVPENDDQTQKTNPSTSNFCVHCGKSLPSKSMLIAHLRVHTGERPFACNEEGCDKDFKTSGALTLHRKRHTGDKTHVCTYENCNMKFIESSNLKRHINTHLKEKPHVCQTCHRGFGRLFLLQIHERTHTGERPFPCNECGKAFAQQGDLAAHKRRHTGEKPHKCSTCGAAFIKSGAMKRHMKKHAKKEANNAIEGAVEYVVIDNRNNYY